MTYTPLSAMITISIYYITFGLKFQVRKYEFFMKDYSFLIASSAESFIARIDGYNPETNPTSAENTIAAMQSQIGIIEEPELTSDGST